MKTYIRPNIRPETHKRLKVTAAQRDKQIIDHIDDLSKIPIKVIEERLKDK